MEIVVRASIVFWFLWLVTRCTGKRVLAELAPFELLLVVVLGDLIQQGVTGQDYSVTGALLAVSTIALWILLLSYVSYRWRRGADVLAGSPLVIVRDGRPLEDVLRSDWLNVEEVKEAARGQGIADLSQIAYAVLEADGKFSFVRRDGQPTPGAPSPEA